MDLDKFNNRNGTDDVCHSAQIWSDVFSNLHKTVSASTLHKLTKPHCYKRFKIVIVIMFIELQQKFSKIMLISFLKCKPEIRVKLKPLNLRPQADIGTLVN